MRGGLSAGLGVIGATLQTTGFAPTGTFYPMAPGGTLATVVQGCFQGFSGCVL